MTLELLDVIEVIGGAASDIVGGGQELQLLLLVGAGEKLAAVKPDVTRENFVPVVRELLRQLNADWYIMVAEAWFTCLKPDSQWFSSLTAGSLRVRDLPPDDKIEAVWILSVTRHGEIASSFAPIISLPSGRQLGGFRSYISGDGTESGAMVVRRW